MFVCDIAYICDIHVLGSWAIEEIQKLFSKLLLRIYMLYITGSACGVSRERIVPRGGAASKRGAGIVLRGGGNCKKRRENILWKICFLDKRRMPSENVCVDTNPEKKCLMGGL